MIYMVIGTQNSGKSELAENLSMETGDSSRLYLATMKIYDEAGYRGKEYVRSYIYMVNVLQDLEDNYMKYWIEFLRVGEFMSEKAIKEIEERYKKDQERRNK